MEEDDNDDDGVDDGTDDTPILSFFCSDDDDDDDDGQNNSVFCTVVVDVDMMVKGDVGELLDSAMVIGRVTVTTGNNVTKQHKNAEAPHSTLVTVAAG